jgi:hypothetical protein
MIFLTAVHLQANSLTPRTTVRVIDISGLRQYRLFNIYRLLSSRLADPASFVIGNSFTSTGMQNNYQPYRVFTLLSVRNLPSIFLNFFFSNTALPAGGLSLAIHNFDFPLPLLTAANTIHW